MNFLKEELRIYFTAQMFYTRLPCPAGTDHSAAYLNKATRYFPLIGWVVGTISYGVFVGSSMLWGQDIALLLAMLAGMLTTGAFHEDGLADACDGFGGGWSKSAILDIMKDSRVGTYGVVGLTMVLGLKFLAMRALAEGMHFSELPWHRIWLLLVMYHALARWTAIQLAFVSIYAREDALSKVKPLAVEFGWREKVWAWIWGLVPLAWMGLENPWYFGLLLPLLVLVLGAKAYFERWIGGYTGDCLGAVEQVAELGVWLGLVALWNCT